MPSTINSDDGQTSGSAGLKFTSADDGILQIQNNGNTAMTVSAAGVTTFSAPTVVSDIPRVIATRSSTSGVAYNAWTEITDANYTVGTLSGGTFSSGRFTPNLAGIYQVNVITQTQATSQTIWGSAIFMNGGLSYYSFTRSAASTTNMSIPVSFILSLNGTTDFVGAGYYIGASSGATSLLTWFSVCLLQRTA
jgi:hypothetical protein